MQTPLRPLGIRPADLEAELEARRTSHRAQVDILRSRLSDVAARNAELRQRRAGLEAERDRLEQEIQRILEEFDRALELNPKYVEAHLNRAITLNELGRYEEAKEAFRLAAEYETARSGRFPGAVSARLANAHMALADLYMEAGDPASAETEYRRALDLRPEFLDIRNKLAQALLRRGEYDAAEAELLRVLEANPGFLAARVNLGLVHFRRGDRVAAEREWRACQAQAPEHPQARANLAMLDATAFF